MPLKTIFMSIVTGALYLSCCLADGQVEAAEKTGTASAREKAPAAATKAALAVGDTAPLFTLPGTPTKADVVLADVLKRTPVLLAFYPMAFTPG